MMSKMTGVNHKDKENVTTVTGIIDNLCFNVEGFCRAMTEEHRTSQQNFTRLCIHWLATCASDDYRYDVRNEASHRVSKALIESQDADFIYSIPYI